MELKDYIIIFILMWNVFVFILYGIDKYKAQHNMYRIRELTLIVPAFFFAFLGAMLGMIIFNHKTSKAKFRFFIPLAFAVNIVVIVLLKQRNLF